MVTSPKTGGASSIMTSFTVETRNRTDFMDITAAVAAAVKRLKDRQCVTVFIPHTTAGITINEKTDPHVTADLAAVLERMVPWKGAYKHKEGNSPAHIKASLIGSSEHVLLNRGQLQLGPWQAIFLCEFDGPRRRQIWVG